MRKLPVFIWLALMVQGCHVDKKDPRSTHVNAEKIEGSGSSPANNKANYYGIDLKHLLANTDTDPQTSIQKILLPLAVVILNQKNLSSPDFKAHVATNTALNFFNSQLMKAFVSERSNPEAKAMIVKYRELLLKGCFGAELTGCQNLDFFSRDPQVVGLIKVMILQTADIEQYYSLIAIAFELKSTRPDAELSQMCLARLTDLLKLYVHVEQRNQNTDIRLKALSLDQRRRFVGYTTFLNTVMHTSSGVKLSDEQAVELFSWLASGKMTQVLGKDLAQVISRLVAPQLDQPRIWSSFIKVFRRSESNDELSYSNALKRVKDSDSGLFNRLGVTPYNLDSRLETHSKDVAALYYLSRLTALKSAIKERYLWEIANLDPAQAMDLIETYVRVTLIDRALDTHKRLADFYRKYQRDGSAKTELVFEAVRFSDQNLTPSWKDYVTRIQRLETFFADEIERRYSNEKGTPLALKIAKLRNFFEELNPAIKYMVTYPNMIMFGYYAAKMNLNMKLLGLSGERIEINKDLILHELMEGGLPPLFTFTSFRPTENRRDREGIDSVQMLWSLYFAMASDLPKLYGIRAEEFLRTFITAYKARTDKRMRTIIDRHKIYLQPNSEIQQLLRICAAPEESFGLFRNQIDLNNLSQVTFLGEMSLTLPPLRTAVNITNLKSEYLQASMDEAIETLRTDVDPLLRRIFLIKSAVAKAPSTDRAALNQIDSLMAESLTMRESILSSTRILIERMPPCVQRFRQIELNRRHELIGMEIDFLNNVSMALKRLAEARSEIAALSALKLNPFFAALDVAKPAITALNEAVINGTGLETPFQHISGYREDFFRHAGFRKSSDGRIYFAYRKRDMLIRMAMYLTKGFQNRQISTKLDQLIVTLPASLKELESRMTSTLTSLDFKGPVSEELQLYSLPDDGVLRAGLEHFRAHFHWFGDVTSAPPIYRHFLRHMTALYKFKSLGPLNLENQVECDWACQNRNYEDARAGAIQLIETSRSMLEDFRMHPRDEILLNLFEVPGYFSFHKSNGLSKTGPEHLFTTENSNRDILGLTDEVFTYLTSKRLGYQPSFRGLRETAERYVTTEINEKTAESLITRPDYYVKAEKLYGKTLRDKQKLLLFPVDPTIDQQIELFHRLFIQTDLMLADLFISTAHEWSKANPLPPVKFLRLESPVLMPVLSTTLIGNYRMQIRKFHDHTQGVFADVPK